MITYVIVISLCALHMTTWVIGIGISSLSITTEVIGIGLWALFITTWVIGRFEPFPELLASLVSCLIRLENVFSSLRTRFQVLSSVSNPSVSVYSPTVFDGVSSHQVVSQSWLVAVAESFKDNQFGHRTAWSATRMSKWRSSWNRTYEARSMSIAFACVIKNWSIVTGFEWNGTIFSSGGRICLKNR